MMIKNLLVDSLFAALGPAAGFVAFGMASKKSKSLVVPALAGGLAAVVGSMLATYAQQKATGLAGLVAERVGALNTPNIYIRERSIDGQPSRLPRMPGAQQNPYGYGQPRGYQGSTQQPYQGSKDRVAALQMEALRGVCQSCW